MNYQKSAAALMGLMLVAAMAMQSRGDPSTGLGAPTWNGLRFGMTELEVKQVLKSRAVRPSEDEKSLDKKLYVPWVVHSVSVEGLSGTATVFLSSKSRRLCQIMIDLAPPSDMSSYAVSLRLESLRETLSKKYGHPFLGGDCAETNNCKTT